MILRLRTRAAGPTLPVATAFYSVPLCSYGLGDVPLRVLFLRQTHDSSARILLCRVHVKYAFRQVLVDPAGAPTFGYVFDDHVVVDSRLQIGWRNGSEFWGVDGIRARA